MIVVYDILDNDVPVFYGTYKEVADYFKTDTKTITCQLCRKELRERRYRLEKIRIEDE